MNRVLVALLVVQSLLLVVLTADRLMPEAHASQTVRCEITNWPGALTGSGFDAVRVRVDEVRGTVPVRVDRWNANDVVRVQSR